MAQKGQFSVEDLDVSSVDTKPKGKFSVADIMDKPTTSPTKEKIESLSTDTGLLGGPKVPDTMTPESSRWLAHPVNAFKEGAVSALGLDPNNIIKSGIGIDPEHPWSDTTAESLKNSVVGQQVRSGLGSLPGAAIEPKSISDIHPLEGISNLYNAVAAPAKEGAAAIREKDPGKFMHALGGIVAVTAPAVKGGIEVATPPIENMAANIRNRPEPVLNPINGEQVNVQPRRPRTGLFSNEISPRTQFPASNPPPFASDLAKASGGEKAYWLRDKLENTTQLAVNDLKLAERDVLHAPVQNAEEYYRILPEAKKAVWNEYQKYLDKGLPISGDQIVKRSIANIPDEVRLNHPNDYSKIVQDLQERYGGKTYDTRTAQTMLEGLNADAKTFYKQSSTDRAGASKTPAAAKWEPPADALRSLLDESLPQGGSRVRKRYGALSELAEEMPAPSEEGTGFIKGMIKKSAQAMSTRPGYAFMRGAMRQLQETSSDALIKRAFRDMPSPVSPEVVPNTHPLTTPKVQGPNPLAVTPHPMATVPQIMTGEGRLGESVIQNSAARPAVPPQLESIQGKSQFLPHELEGPQISPSQNPHPLSGLDVNQLYGEMPHQVQGNPIPPSSPHGIPTGLNTTGVGNVVTEPQTPLTHPLSQGYSQITTPNTPNVPDFRGNEPASNLYGPQTPSQLDVSQKPINSPSDVRYQGVRPSNVPTDTMNLMNRGTFSSGLPSTGMPIQTPSPETLGKLGEKIGKNKIRTGLRK